MIVNTTPHAITFLLKPCAGTDEDLDQVYEAVVPPCGVLINATAVEEPAGTLRGASLVRTRFVASEEEDAKLRALEEANPDGIVVGSIIAAQAFPGRVFGLVAAPGFERVPVAQKRMSINKFITFQEPGG